MKNKIAKWWNREGEKVRCELCPRYCLLGEGQDGFCFVRKNEGGELVAATYGKSTGLCIDPIEKKPLNHFYPGSSILSFGTAGCNLNCQFCQNWMSSKSKEVLFQSVMADPLDIAMAAKKEGCKSVAFTYNEPIIFAEYVIDTARACHDQGIKTVAVTAGYINKKPRQEFFSVIDAANVDLKGFNEEFYKKYVGGDINAILDTLKYIANETDVWLEITNLIIPGLNDDSDEIKKMCDWIVENLGVNVPLHFSAFHPSYKMKNIPSTPLKTVKQAYEIAKAQGVLYPYTGNVMDKRGDTTYCSSCRKEVIVREWYDISKYSLVENKCLYCETGIAGRFEKERGNWGRKREPVRV